MCISESSSRSPHRTGALVDVLSFFLTVRHVPLSGNLVESAIAPLAKHSVIDFIAGTHILIHTVAGAPTRHPRRASAAASTPSAPLRLAESDRLPSRYHSLPQLVALGLPPGHRGANLLLLKLAVHGSAPASELCLLSVHHALIRSVEHFALLTEDFLADVLMPG